MGLTLTLQGVTFRAESGVVYRSHCVVHSSIIRHKVVVTSLALLYIPCVVKLFNIHGEVGMVEVARWRGWVVYVCKNGKTVLHFSHDRKDR